MDEQKNELNDPYAWDSQAGAERYASMSDEELVELAQKGDGEALPFLLDKYKNFVRARARSYFLIGADHEDIVQEGMIGLYKAIRDYRPEKLAGFRDITAEFFLDEENYRDARERLAEDVKAFNSKMPSSKNVKKIKVRDIPFEKTTTMKIKRYLLNARASK